MFPCDLEHRLRCGRGEGFCGCTCSYYCVSPSSSSCWYRWISKRPLLASTLASGRACDNGQPRALKRTFTDIDEPSAIALPKTGYPFLKEYYFMCRATSLSSATTTKTASVSYVRCMEGQIRPLWLHSMEYVSVHDFCAKYMMRCTKCGARLRARYASKRRV